MLSTDEILKLLDKLETHTADDLETEYLEFKPWNDIKSVRKDAIEYTVCFANASGGVIVFGVKDQVKGRKKAIQGIGKYDADRFVKEIYQCTSPSIKVQIEEISVAEGTGKLLVLRVPKQTEGVFFSTSEGLYKKRVGKNCMPLDANTMTETRISTGALDWSGSNIDSIDISALDSLEIERGRRILRSYDPNSQLLGLDDLGFLNGLGAMKGKQVTHTGLLLFGKEEVITQLCPQHQIHYIYQKGDTQVIRNEIWKGSLLKIIENIEAIYSSPMNPEYELSIGLFKRRIPEYPIEVVREAFLNAVSHRDYQKPDEIIFRHREEELTITSPGGFIAGITPNNILRHEPASRNRTLSEAFQHLHLVERAGVGSKRIYRTLLIFGKNIPKYETDGSYVTLRVFDGTYNEKMVKLIVKWNDEGRQFSLDTLLILSYLTKHHNIIAVEAEGLLQTDHDEAKRILDSLSIQPNRVLEKRGRTKSASYYLTKETSRALLDKVAYSTIKGIDPSRYKEMVHEYVKDHGRITPTECRKLLGFGESNSERVKISRLLKKWSLPDGFLRATGNRPKTFYEYTGV
jgi:ATP-dependent DNA helicase RecG